MQENNNSNVITMEYKWTDNSEVNYGLNITGVGDGTSNWYHGFWPWNHRFPDTSNTILSQLNQQKCVIIKNNGTHLKAYYWNDVSCSLQFHCFIVVTLILDSIIVLREFAIFFVFFCFFFVVRQCVLFAFFFKKKPLPFVFSDCVLTTFRVFVFQNMEAPRFLPNKTQTPIQKHNTHTQKAEDLQYVLVAKNIQIPSDEKDARFKTQFTLKNHPFYHVLFQI